ncbi:hypothetical protein GCM10018781_80160 [Kitasatospora indigofera]|uniref:Uncharacterized protein n=1 Tax=Kitasatospora indigofera TaxID=67307 RepID=A0A918YXL6_9ACTN|nr:hypothetical protein GCM10018781_80160 [Kitasatospora indigofera]
MSLSAGRKDRCYPHAEAAGPVVSRQGQKRQIRPSRSPGVRPGYRFGDEGPCRPGPVVRPAARRQARRRVDGPLRPDGSTPVPVPALMGAPTGRPGAAPGATVRRRTGTECRACHVRPGQGATLELGST